MTTISCLVSFNNSRNIVLEATPSTKNSDGFANSASSQKHLIRLPGDETSTAKSLFVAKPTSIPENGSNIELVNFFCSVDRTPRSVSIQSFPFFDSTKAHSLMYDCLAVQFDQSTLSHFVQFAGMSSGIPFCVNFAKRFTPRIPTWQRNARLIPFSLSSSPRSTS